MTANTIRIGPLPALASRRQCRLCERNSNSAKAATSISLLPMSARFVGWSGCLRCGFEEPEHE
jgi:hypothetical protein